MRASYLLTALAAFGLVVACGASTPDGAANGAGESGISASAELPLDIDAHTLFQELARRGVTSKSEALALLPKPFKQRFVLVTDTGALGLSSRARPRVIHFTEDAKLIIATSGFAFEQDPTAHAFEILEHDAATNGFRTHTIELTADGPKMTENDARCAACHGASGKARPIWGSYPDWPTAYGGTLGHAGVDDMAPDELVEFKAFVAAAKTDPDYRHLEIHPNQNGFVLATPYGNANTLLSNVFGNRQAANLYARIAQSPLYPQLEYALVADDVRCDLPADVEAYVNRLYSAYVEPSGFDAKRAVTKMYRLLGVEATTDMRLAQTLLTPVEGAWEPGWFDWNSGTDYLSALTGFQAFARLVATDPGLGALFATTAPRIATVNHDAFHASRAEYVALQNPAYEDATGPSIHWTMLYPVMNPPDDPRAPGEGKKDAVCNYLIGAQRARQQ